MTRRRRNARFAFYAMALGWPGALLAGVLASAAARLYGYTYSYGSVIVGGTGLALVSCAWSFLLTILIPRAPDWSVSAACALPWLALALLLLIDEDFGPGVSVLLMSVLLCYPIGYAGVRTARRRYPIRCTPRGHWPAPGEPCCPECGYGLYYSKNQICPECGQYFSLLKVDMRRAQWDGYVLKPWEPGKVE